MLFPFAADALLEEEDEEEVAVAFVLLLERALVVLLEEEGDEALVVRRLELELWERARSHIHERHNTKAAQE